jgi:hypothetical protein
MLLLTRCVGRFGSLFADFSVFVENLLAPNFPVNFDENCSLSRDASVLYATIIPQNKTLFSLFHRDLRMRCLSLVHVIVLNFALG